MTYGTPNREKAPTKGAADAVPAAGKAGTVCGLDPQKLQSLATGLAHRVKLTEEQIQKAVFENLFLRGKPGILYWHVPNGGVHQKDVQQRVVNKLRGVLAGIPDIHISHQGKMYFLELKTLRGKMSPMQQSIAWRLKEQGHVYGCCYGLDDAIAWLEKHNLVSGKTIIGGEI